MLYVTNIIFECIVAFVLSALATAGIAWLMRRIERRAEQRKQQVAHNLEALAAKARASAIIEFEMAMERARANPSREFVQAELDMAEWISNGSHQG